jgi:transposase InsO family protein/transposase-like protein
MVYENYWRAKCGDVLAHHERWRKQADAVGLSAEGRLRLEWIIYAELSDNVAKTCRHFGIGSSTFYKWKKLFDPSNIRSLESRDRSPGKRRGRQAVPLLDERVIALRKRYMYWGKMKIQTVYIREYGEYISSHYIQRVIETYKLYPPRRKKKGTTEQTKKHRQTKKRITEFGKEPTELGFLLHLDTVEVRLAGVKRYVLTAIDGFSRFGFAYAYKNHSSATAKDFLLKLYDFFGEHMVHVHTDNGSEFHKHFDEAVQQLALTHWWSRVRKSTDNAKDERFNRTFRDECLAQGSFHKDIHIFNRNILAWIIEYLTVRPHQSLNYLTPIEFIQKTTQVSTMWSSSTTH